MQILQDENIFVNNTEIVGNVWIVDNSRGRNIRCLKFLKCRRIQKCSEFMSARLLLYKCFLKRVLLLLSYKI